MFKVSVMYPNEYGTSFNFDYYVNKHMKLVEKYMKPFGLAHTSVDKGISGGGNESPPFICVGNLYFESIEGYDKGVAEVGNLLRSDIPNFTNVKPIRQISKIL
jgi:uncharacterized protein (TIGR02118 family)